LNIFQLENENISTKGLLSLILIAYTFSIAIRLIWVYQFSGVDSFMWDNQLMINTNDGYFFASGAKTILDGATNLNPRIPSLFSYGLTFFTVLFAKITPFSLETITLYMPAFISSIVVIPIILLSRLYKLTLFGFFAALIASIAWSYYNRTMIGYYDTDMFSAMAPMFILYFLIRTIENESLNSAFISALVILVYPFLYDQGLSIVYAMGLIYMAYMVLFHRKIEFTYQSIVMISIALMGIPWFIKIVLLVGVYFIFKNKTIPLKQLIIFAIVAVLTFIITGHVVSLIWAKIATYAIRGEDQNGLHFFQVNQTVREAGKIPFSIMANRISGSTMGILTALIGYIFLVIKYRPFILALPLIGIGVFSLWGGLRFTVYAVPVAAMGSIFLFYIVTSFISNKVVKYSLISILTLAILYPNIAHIIGYKVPTVFNKAEVQILDKLKKVSNPKDYTLTWWDYGYPIWYYSNTNTLIDGGKHNQDNFIISQILKTTSQQQAANLSRLAVETYVSSDYKIAANEIFKNNTKEQKDPNLLLSQLKSNDYKLPAKTRDIFLYLPNRMMGIFPTVTLFSNIDLNTGQKQSRPFFYQSTRFKETGNNINLGNNINITKNRGEIQIGRQKLKLNSFVITTYDKKGKLRVRSQTIDKNSPISVIFMQNYHRFLVLDNKTLKSTFIQMFVLENYDKNLFEPVILNPLAKVYKLKI